MNLVQEYDISEFRQVLRPDGRELTIEMGLRFPNQKHESVFFVTTTFNEWQPYGKRPGVYESLSSNLQFYVNKYEAKLPGYVLMPTHLHLLIAIKGSKLSDFMRDYKKYIAQRAFPEIGINDKLIWMPRFDRVAINTEAVFRTKLEYIHHNPVKAGLVDSVEDWRWSSASAYYSSKLSDVPIWTGWK
jgi:REP-associated tyrosine transposase